MRPKTKRTIVALEALEVALAELAKLPETPETEALLSRGFALQREVKAWADKPATPVQREAMMKKVLALHIAISKMRAAAT
jgi:hypothetical protein